ncbi:MAG: efflux RND transporter permease subunit [Proteobacteria bacterium]|nr:efflux RND transporter permease subunit [Pseudomonadota bacterium]
MGDMASDTTSRGVTCSVMSSTCQLPRSRSRSRPSPRPDAFTFQMPRCCSKFVTNCISTVFPLETTTWLTQERIRSHTNSSAFSIFPLIGEGVGEGEIVGDGGTVGVGEGGEFYRPMAVAIIGGTITSTLLTLLIVPTFYDSIEIARDRAVAKFRRRAARFTVAGGFLLTLVEALLALLLVRLLFRLLMQPLRLLARRRAAG